MRSIREKSELEETQRAKFFQDAKIRLSITN
jgi:hypothetical protein